MDRKELLILLMLRENKAFSNATAMTLQELISDGLAGYRVNTIYKSVQKLLEAGFVQYGLKDGHANTYSISKSGLDKIGEFEV